jgi:iron complex transport system substrate-binding protein
VRLTWDQVAQADPEIIVLMPCGYDLAQTIAQYNDLRRAPAWFPGWQCLSAVRSGKVYAVNGTAYFSRPGPRLVDGAEILQAIIGDASLDSLPKHSVMLLAWPAGHKDVPAGV